MSVLEIRDEPGWRHLILNRPEKRNALSLELLDAIEAELLKADADDAVHAILISANGPDFSAGFDLMDQQVEAGHLDDPMHQYGPIWRGRQVMRLIPDLKKPVVVKVHGRCYAGGTELAFIADLVYATDTAEFAFPPVRDMGTPAVPMWLYHAGPQWAKRLLLTGDSVSGADAARIGLVLKALPEDQLDGEVEGVMKRLAKIDWQLLAVQKRVVNAGLEAMGMHSVHRVASLLDTLGLQSPTARDLAKAEPSELVARYVQRRDEVFGRGLTSVTEADTFDEEGRLVR
jgi:enoyl-CoA hydratase